MTVLPLLGLKGAHCATVAQATTRLARVCNAFWAPLPAVPQSRHRRRSAALTDAVPLIRPAPAEESKEAVGSELRVRDGGQYLRSIQQVEPGSSRPPCVPIP